MSLAPVSVDLPKCGFLLGGQCVLDAFLVDQDQSDLKGRRDVVINDAYAATLSFTPYANGVRTSMA